MYMKSYTLLALLAGTMMSTTEAIELQAGADAEETKTNRKCCALFSGDPKGKRTTHTICAGPGGVGEWTGKDLAERRLTNISGYRCDKDAHLEFC